jgi:TolB-like protein
VLPEIFLSYSREDQVTARRFAEGLAREGFSVWWDQSLNAGEDFDRVTELALADSRAVVVLWSKRSVDSRWVRAEATEAKANNRLVPVMIEPCKRPILFELTHTADLADWQGDAQNPRWRSFIDGLRKMTGGAAPAPSPGAATTSISLPPTAQRRWGVPVAIIAAALIAGAVAWYFHSRTPTATAATGTPQATGAIDASIAVLPFVNMSADPEQEYFSDGLSEELINQLAHIEGLRVTARTSAFSFKGKSEDLRAVGKALGVAQILEGSVRKAGGRIRVTVQLINASTGYHMWSETFDRATDDVFAIQDEIATTVAGRLGPTLAAPKTADFGGTRSFEAYDHLLRGNAEFAKQTPDGFNAAVVEYRRALALDPNFARAYAEFVITTGARGNPLENAALEHEREDAVRKALQSAPDAPLTQVANMWILSDSHKWVEADAACAKVFAARSDPRAEGICGGFLTLTGRVRAALPYREAFRSSDPLSLAASQALMRHYTLLGMESELRREYARLDGPPVARRQAEEAMLVFLASARAPQEELDKQLARACASMTPPSCAAWTTAIRTPGQAPSQLRTQFQAIRATSLLDVGELALAAAYVGDSALALDALQLYTSKAGSAGFQIMWYPLLGEARKDPRFKQLVRELGFVDLWRRTGRWADSCRALGADDFECF